MDRNLLVKYLEGECTDQERNLVEQKMAEHPSFRKTVEDMQEIWRQSGKLNTLLLKQAYDSEADWELFKKRIETDPAEQKQQSRTRKQATVIPVGPPKWVWIAASFLIVALGGIAFSLFVQSDSPNASAMYREIVAARGEQVSFRLSDGSSIKLNADSRLRVPENFSKEQRTVFLEGEALFEVESNKDWPFVVHSKHAKIQVLGTVFAVKSYAGEAPVQVVVKEGSVSLEFREDSGISSVLKEGELGRLDKNDKEINIQEVKDFSLYLGWSTGTLKFEDTSLADVAGLLSRYFDVEVRLKDPSMDSLRVTASLKLRSLETILDRLSASLDIEYSKEGRKVILH